ncbi:PREDICTED: (-)-camphene/tricyclene synthase, chloroplastic-like [Nicotiana attenuata]|uniref:(-)-camphenetricyclene synthase, chloroplastic n=1 Tax=Nicotiana attenuata TaxID=49451 RepID=A0A314KUW2_NICAT|nr:PREDICTED: (-)-camphene/tricyclene synthase, chloroplastic-like [Nicotiana attenuata]OIT33133.1 (-)-camphenetricyclene synthase, chloroplastic [Nicotiana attenuata]
MLLMATSIRPAAPSLSYFSGRKASLVSKAKACSMSKANSTSPKAEPPLSHNSIPTNMNTHRRSGYYKPPTWPFEYIQSINNDYVGKNYVKRFNELKEEIRKKLKIHDIDGAELDKLELIDNLQRLGLSYHFKEEIFQILRSIHQQQILQQEGRNVVSGEYSLLYATSLKFKLLREYGFDISQETENTLKFATKVTKSELKNYLENYEYSEENVTTTLVRHALELPSHWMMLRLETRWYLNVYEKMPNANPLLLELAKLDFNIVQATHQQELKDVSRWWKNTCLAKKLPFSRDRLVECFFWAVGMVLFEPQQGHCRVNLAKINALATTLDDIYDIYGTYHELQLFTDAVERWDLKAMEQLPEYMKVMYLAMFNTINEIVYEVLKEQGINVLPYLIKPWTDLCKAYLREARWYYNGYKPTMQEYMDNAWISVAMPMILTHTFFLVTNPITKEELESLSKYPDIIRWSSTIVRFADDLGTSSDELKRGDVPKSIQCYMNETGASEEEAREHVQYLIKETWEMLNKAQTENLLFSGMFVEIAKNTARTAQCMYLHGDGHGIQNAETKNSISKILFEHITVPNPFMSPNSSP